MDEPLQILCDELASQGKSWEEIQDLACSLPTPEDQLDLAEWLARHRGASKQEVIEEKHRLIRNRLQKQSSITPGMMKYCVIGNIVKERTDDAGNVRNGTVAFPGEGRQV